MEMMAKLEVDDGKVIFNWWIDGEIMEMAQRLEVGNHDKWQRGGKNWENDEKIDEKMEMLAMLKVDDE